MVIATSTEQFALYAKSNESKLLSLPVTFWGSLMGFGRSKKLSEQTDEKSVQSFPTCQSQCFTSWVTTTGWNSSLRPAGFSPSKADASIWGHTILWDTSFPCLSWEAF